MADVQGGKAPANQWQDWVNLVFAIWLFISPWVLGFVRAGEANAVATTPAWNAWVFAVVIGVLSIAALVRALPWEEGINILAGIWLVISPWVLEFNEVRPAKWNALIIGALVVILAGWDLNTMQPSLSRRS